MVDPQGQVLAGPVFGEPAISMAELDLTLLMGGKFDLDTSVHYPRPDLFQLDVDTQPQSSETMNRDRVIRSRLGGCGRTSRR